MRRAGTGIRSPKDIRSVYTAATEAAAKERFTEFTEIWGAQYPAITQLWENAWSEFVPFLDYDVEIRRVICSTNAVVISSALISVFDVRHGSPRTPVLSCGRGYLQRSRRQSLRRWRSACGAGGLAGHVAGVLDGCR